MDRVRTEFDFSGFLAEGELGAKEKLTKFLQWSGGIIRYFIFVPQSFTEGQVEKVYPTRGEKPAVECELTVHKARVPVYVFVDSHRV